jgi:Xaa-Pro aminopeptidase
MSGSIPEIPEIPEIPAERYAVRLAGARREAAVAGLDALLIGVGADLRYLTGYDAVALERLTMLVVPVAEGAQLTLIAPRLETTPARACAAVA